MQWLLRLMIVIALVVFAGAAAAQETPPDVDGDSILDLYDACPLEAGTVENFGCPDGVLPPDQDGDGVVDLLDSCPTEAGDPSLGGCLDQDGDSFPDAYDECPDAAGAIYGCPEVRTAEIPTPLTPLTAENITRVSEVASLRVELPRLDASPSGTLAVRAGLDLLLYDLMSASLAPRATVETTQAGFPVAVGGAGIVTVESDETDESGVVPAPYLQVRDASGTPVVVFDAGGLGLGVYALHPTEPLMALTLVMAQGDAFGETVTLWDVNTGEQVREIAVLTGERVGEIAFSADGSLLLVSKLDPSGTLTAYDAATGAQRWQTTLLDPAENLLLVGMVGLANSDQIAALDVLGNLYILDAATGALLAAVSLPHEAAYDLAVNPEGTLLISADVTTVHFWGIPTQ